MKLLFLALANLLKLGEEGQELVPQTRLINL